jgi:hypothetical protein
VQVGGVEDEVDHPDEEEAACGGQHQRPLWSPGRPAGDEREAEVETADVGDEVLVVRGKQVDPVGDEGEVRVEGVRGEGGDRAIESA